MAQIEVVFRVPARWSKLDASPMYVVLGISALQSVDWADQPAVVQLETVREVESLGRLHDALVYQVLQALTVE